MPLYVAFLRAINVGGRNVTMSKLKADFEELGLANVRTFIASGNVIFETGRCETGRLERRIESHLARSLGYAVSAFVRTDAEIGEIAHCRPFTDKQMDSATAFNVAFLARPLDAAAALAMTKFKSEIDDFHIRGREVYWVCRKRQSESAFSNAAFERALKLRATLRSMSTLGKLAARIYPQPGGR